MVKKNGRKKRNRSTGRFINFPSIIHGNVKISHKTSIKRLKRIVAETLRSLNGIEMPRTLSVASRAGLQEGVMKFEIGIADGFYFDYVDQETFEKLIDSLKNKKVINVLDVLIVISYYYLKEKKRIPLHFDHIIIRFLFKPKELNLYLYHVRGIRRLPLDELVHHIILKIREKMKKYRLKTFNIEYLRTY